MQTHTSSPVSNAYVWYAVWLMFGINMLNYIDRMVLAVIVEEIRVEIPMTDTQIGLLTGFAFAIFYAIAGLAIGRMADIYSRKKILFWSISIWSAATAAGAFVTSYIQLLLARIAVGIGEAGALPTTQSIVADYCPVEKRAAAYALLNAGGTIGLTIGLIGGGWVAQNYGWRQAFFVAGIIGVPFLFLLLTTFKEPQRGAMDAVAHSPSKSNLRESLNTLWESKSYIYIVISSCFTAFLLFGVAQWLPAFLIRKFGLSPAEVGMYMGAMVGSGTLIGAVLGGFLANRLAKQHVSWLVRFPMLLSLSFIPLYLLVFYASNLSAALGFLLLANLAGSASFGAILASMHSVLPATSRGIGTAVYGFMAALFGVGLAPLVVGVLSDFFANAGAEPAQALQQALAIAVFAGAGTVYGLFLAKRNFIDDLQRLGITT